MSRPHVTITLGRSGQKVVKRSSASQSNSFGQQTLSRGKRSLAETYKLDSEDPSRSLRKRVQGYKGGGGSRYDGMNDARVGQNDLRLKLLRSRRQREILQAIEERKKERQKVTTRTVQSTEQSHRRPVTIGQPSTGASEVLLREAVRSSYASQISGVVKPKSPNRLAKDSGEVSSSKNIPAGQHRPTLRPAEASRTTRVLEKDLLLPDRPKGLTPVAMRTALATGNLVSGLSSANGRTLQQPQPDEPPSTVASLLDSLGLGKYAINFQAEEVDMAALNQMGDRDLKELGIPMGPRKKILLAMLARAKRPLT